ncbi:unnamed protein product, partial [Polarella glacialis]
DMRPWLLPDGKGADVLVIGVQELVELGPMSMFLGTDGDEERQTLLEKRVESVLATTGGRYVKMCSFGMVGLALLTYVRGSLDPHVGEVFIDRVKTGMEGMGGNKGGLCLRFVLGRTSFCFVNVHLPSGATAASERNEHMSEILTYAFQSINRTGSIRPSKLGFRRDSVFAAAKHDLTVVFGDTNSRLEPSSSPKSGETMPLGPPEAWLLRDDLLLGKLSCLDALNFREGEVCFPPTYKYIVGTDQLSDKRCPAWCDRVLYRSQPMIVPGAPQPTFRKVDLMEYDSFGSLKRTSDHRPVAALFGLEVGLGQAAQIQGRAVVLQPLNREQVPNRPGKQHADDQCVAS